MNLCSKRCGGVVLFLAIIAIVAGSSSTARGANTVLKFNTILGDIHIRMLDNDAPGTVGNFLDYVNRGDYADSFFHRMVPGFVLQGGGFRLGDSGGEAIPTDPQIQNEFGRSNVRGTLAMAKLGTGPHTATSQFFFNLSDNSANLDNQNGGFSVFAYVIGDSMDIVDVMSAALGDPYAVQGYNLVDYWPDNGRSEYWDNALGDVPLLSSGGSLYFELVNSVTVLDADGDFDLDGDVDDDDYDGLLASFGYQGVGLAADFDGDYDVDLADFVILQANYTGAATAPLPTPGASVPEPTSICLLGLGGLALVRKRRKA